MSERVRVGISTCPNDTFAFHGLLSGAVDSGPLAFDFELHDVQLLNRRLLAGDFDLVKASFAAALPLGEEVVVLPVGSALGFGVGPLLLARERGAHPDRAATSARVLCPGEHTTATLLYRLFHPGKGRLEQVVFSAILPALASGQADFGVCIHEGRFTYEQHGLVRVEDLGERWEQATGLPLPLGGLFARRSLAPATLDRATQAIADSIEYGLAHRDEALPTMRAHAQELEDEVLVAHVDLYVNQWTRALGREGREAIAVLGERARASGLLPAGGAPLETL